MAPFGAFVAFLRIEIIAVARLAENMPKQKKTMKMTYSHLDQGDDQKKPSSPPGRLKTCVVHGDG